MTTNINDGKKLYASFSEAEKVAEKMSRTHNEGFNVYKVEGMWAVGGVHFRKNNKQKIKSFDDLRIILNEFMSDKDDSSVEEYIEEIENDLQSKESTVQGEDTDWMLKDVKILLGKEIGMSINNNNSYLVLFVEKGIEKISLKMGGNFSQHIPLIQRQANSLINSNIIWHTWNSKSSNWQENAWFYRIEKKI
jgi:hypothetical protein